MSRKWLIVWRLRQDSSVTELTNTGGSQTIKCLECGKVDDGDTFRAFVKSRFEVFLHEEDDEEQAAQVPADASHLRHPEQEVPEQR